MKLEGLCVISGPMYAGKTSALVNLASLARAERLVGVRCFVPHTDTRSAKMLRSHDGRTTEATSFSDPSEIRQLLAPTDTHVLIDEVQFSLPSLAAEVGRMLADGKIVVAAGLDMDYLRVPFATTSALVAMSSNSVILVARCSVCGGMALYSYRKQLAAQSRADRVVVGGKEMYEARCGVCWDRGMASQRAAL